MKRTMTPVPVLRRKAWIRISRAHSALSAASPAARSTRPIRTDAYSRPARGVNRDQGDLSVNLAALKTVGVFAAVGAIIGNVLATAISPRFLTWYNTPGAGSVQTICNIEQMSQH